MSITWHLLLSDLKGLVDAFRIKPHENPRSQQMNLIRTSLLPFSWPNSSPRPSCDLWLLFAPGRVEKMVKSCQNPNVFYQRTGHFFMQRCHPSERNRLNRSSHSRRWCIALPNMKSFLKEMHKCHNCGAIENTSKRWVQTIPWKELPAWQCDKSI